MSPVEKPLWNELEKSIHEPARLGLITTLCGEPDGLAFQELKAECGLTDGNLNRHINVLREAGIVQVHKAGRGRTSRTRVVMTSQGKEAFLDYLHSLEKMLHGAIDSLEAEEGDGSPGLSLAVS